MTRAPNLLFLFPDQHRPDWLKCSTPDLPLRTPHIDALASRGVRFTQAICSSPLCAPSRACVASGRNYDRCGVPGNAVNYPLDQPTYYQSLRTAGYRVAGVGKFDLHKGLGDPENLWWELDGSRDLDAWGFTEGIDNEGKFDGSGSYRRLGEPRGPYLAMLKERGLADAYTQEHANVKKNMGAYTTVLPDDAYCDNWVAENGMRFLREFPQDQPWHLVINFTGPHNPMDVTASMRERWQDVDFPGPHRNDDPDRAGLLRNRQNYAAMIENIDDHVGRFVAAVEARGELDNTIVVYASDHGEMLGDHGRWGKSTWHQASTGVPLIVAGPTVAGSSLCHEPVVLHDLTASFLDWGGAGPLPQMDGQSLRPLLAGQTQSHRAFAVSGLQDFRVVYDGRYKLVSFRDGAEFVFDREIDPWEDVDISKNEPATTARLRAALHSELPAWPESA
ncbi:MAG: sulfatase-like hydrolase/transferase [Gemmatimonadetes bacterium]|jgi:arylsulfatase|nr:sulfatase-like hydrolase/transferase [Gemmatimonadota bacterium]MBT5056712.1 sulfatase-like hydrolase/transferase [Gemmatimonadota bacterium]MBT5145659.1 sulfatase-like hydrolase/transferase [Gemmatimonadota bacterium]MBT5588111.1 sulfatase-like hydrolase/transferase [Gemmatimonadota bacterium]MBT5960723.1 sulfatase-like hydrolase/transferase [Gemmatimonadota bacterium]